MQADYSQPLETNVDLEGLEQAVREHAQDMQRRERDGAQVIPFPSAEERARLRDRRE